jgi:hypothetical protein
MWGTTKRKAASRKGAKTVHASLRWPRSAKPGGETLVTVLPVTHRPPDIAAQAVEIPRAVKQQLGLDDDRSRVVVTEGDQFVWPRYD